LLKRSDIMKNTNKIKFAVLIFYIVIAVILVFFASQFNYTVEDIQRQLAESYVPSVIYVVLMFVATATTLPISAVLFPAIFLFPFWYALGIGFLGVLGGALFIYCLSKYLGTGFVKEYSEVKGGKFKAIKKSIEKNSTGVFVLLNFVYVFPSNLAHMLAAVTETKFYKYFWIMLFGNLANFFNVALFAYGIFLGNMHYVIAASLLILSVTVLPFYVYRNQLREVWLLAFSKKSYKELEKIEEEVGEETTKYDKKIGKAIRTVTKKI